MCSPEYVVAKQRKKFDGRSTTSRCSFYFSPRTNFLFYGNAQSIASIVLGVAVEVEGFFKGNL